MDSNVDEVIENLEEFKLAREVKFYIGDEYGRNAWKIATTVEI